MNSNFEDNVNEVIDKAGISKEELQKKIEALKKEYVGLLSDEGALEIIAKDYHIDIEHDPIFSQKRYYIDQLEAGMQLIRVAGRVEKIYPIKEFERKSGEEGKVVNFILRDKTGIIRATLWDDQVALVEEGALTIGKIIELKNCSVKEGWKGRNEINLGRRSEIELNPDVNLEDFPENEENISKIGELEPDMDIVSIEGRIITMSEVRDIVTRDGRPTKLQELIVADESGQIRVPVWGKKIDNLGEISEGDTIQIINGYTRSFGDQINLNIGTLSSIEINPEGVEVPEIEDLDIPEEKTFSTSQSRIQIKDLMPESRNVNIIAKCIELGEVREVANENRVMEVKLGDETGMVNFSVWNEDINKMKKGETYEIINGYISIFQNKIQLNAGKFGKIVVSEQKITKVDMHNNVSEKEITPNRKRIIELADNQLIEVRGTITDFLSKSPTYIACPECKRKVTIENGKYICSVCGIVPNYETRLLFSFTLDDGTSNIRVTVGGATAEKLLKMASGEGQDSLLEKLDTPTSIQINLEQFLGKEINVIGRTRKNKFDQLEIRAQAIEISDVKNEIKEMLDKFD